MRELMLDQVDTLITNFVHDRPGHSSEAVASHDLLGVAHAAQCCVDRVFAHTLLAGPDTRENVFTVTGERLKAI